MSKAGPALNESVAAQARPRKAPYEIRDPAVRGFLLRVQPTGVKTYYLQDVGGKTASGNGKRVKIGRQSAYTYPEARALAVRLLREHERAAPVNDLRPSLDALRTIRKELAGLLARVDAYIRLLREMK